MPTGKYTPVHFIPVKNVTVVMNLTGRRFGKLIALRLMGFSPLKQKTYWMCECTCGNRIVAPTKDLLKGQAWQSCGCAPRKPSFIKHGMHNSPAYKSWNAMRQRCTNPLNTSYSDYGARGIFVCERWSTFENFLADMGDRPKGKTLERKNNNGNYEPDNCVWATAKEQSQNRRSNVFITYGGKAKTIAEWEERTGLPISKRHGMGWDVHRMMTEPAHKNHSITYQDETRSIHGWERALGFPKECVRSRLRRGWSIEKALTTPVRT